MVADVFDQNVLAFTDTNWEAIQDAVSFTGNRKAVLIPRQVVVNGQPSPLVFGNLLLHETLNSADNAGLLRFDPFHTAGHP
jgi:hypothetical protein